MYCTQGTGDFDDISHQAKRGLFPAFAHAGAGASVIRDAAAIIFMILFTRNTP
jgi:hypothetical protein